MRTILVTIAMLACLGSRTGADVLYEQTADPAGGSFMSAWWDPDGSNYDHYVWDAFTLGVDADVREIRWRGTFGVSGAPTNFTVGIYASIPAGTQPDVAHPPLIEYVTGGNAQQTYAGTFGGVPMYDHAFALPVPFTARAGVKYWLQVEAWQSAFPDWSIAAAQSGDGHYFLCEHNNLAETVVAGAGGVPTGCWFTARTGDAAFALHSAASTAVGDPRGSTDVALGVTPNPTRGARLQVRVTLPDAAAAELSLFDVSGRCVATRDVGALGAGTHFVALAEGKEIDAGVWFVRLTRVGRAVATRAVVVQ